jgi:hypothetical protein
MTLVLCRPSQASAVASLFIYLKLNNLSAAPQSFAHPSSGLYRSPIVNDTCNSNDMRARWNLRLLRPLIANQPPPDFYGAACIGLSGTARCLESPDFLHSPTASRGFLRVQDEE